MRLHDLKIRNFRGITELDWRPGGELVCLLGPGDSCKSTILDAIEYALTPRWVQFTDVDFLSGDTTRVITIDATVGDLPTEALADNRFGLHLHGWSADGTINDEPGEHDLPVVTVRLTVDASLDPTWELINARNQPRQLSVGERRMFGVVRLGEDAEKHLAWSQGSALTRLTNEHDDAATRLAEAYRRARTLVSADAIPGLSAVAGEVTSSAKQLGAYTTQNFSPGLDTQRASMSLGTLSLHDSGIPTRLSGLGTRRLISLAIQQMSVAEGAIVLIDELEHGLEPHRILHILRKLKSMLPDSLGDEIGQVFLTTHSAVSIIELNAADLHITRRHPERHMVMTAPDSVQRLLRSMPEAFLGRRIVVCEGRTEVGILRAMRPYWIGRHEGIPPEHRGAVFVDGQGSSGQTTAIALRKLGYETVLFRDSDVAMTPQQRQAAIQEGVVIVEWEDTVATEHRLLSDLPAPALSSFIAALYELQSADAVTALIARELRLAHVMPQDFSEWQQYATEQVLRTVIANVTKHAKWIKRIDAGEIVGQILVRELQQGFQAPIANTLGEIERWLYA